MSFILLTGIVLTAVPALLILGFSIFVFLAFVRDDPDAANVTRLAFIVMIAGILMIIWHFLSKSF